ncbi:SIS domain-containing protein, partial [Micromonospora aurantiaca]|nr:SIS domain-containing protein [Micromonospora aurantiaca]
DAFRSGGRLFAFGNGTGAADAQAVAALFLNPGGSARPLPALALTNDAGVVTGLSDDIGFEVVYARQLAAFGRPGDIALALSTSGDSDNLIAA